MNIYEYSKCDTCGKTYKGIFELKENGKVECIDCNNVKYLSKVEYKEVTEDSKIIQKIVKDMLWQDVNRIYVSKVEEGEDYLKFVRDEEGNIDSKKLYYQNNTLDLIIELQRAAYDSLTYSEMGEELEYKDFAEKVIETYMKARNIKFTDDEEEEIRRMINSVEMKTIKREVEI